jgi:hypothetical protein
MQDDKKSDELERFDDPDSQYSFDCLPPFLLPVCIPLAFLNFLRGLLAGIAKVHTGNTR